jgi:hypothetical protein
MSGSTMLATINTSGQMSGSSPVLFASTASFVANAQTASFVALAQSASNAVSAATASFANTLTVAGNLTAQTLVVQTITSSIDFVTGSTRFGSISANTHVFTGSVLVSGSIGIGTTPTNTLNVRGDNGTSTAAVVRLRDTNTTARTTRLQFEDYTGNLADGLIDFRIGTAGNASTATLSIGVNSAGLTFNSSNAATFSSSVTANGIVSAAGYSITSGDAISANGNLVLNTGANRHVQIGSSTNYYWRIRAYNDDLEINGGADAFTAVKFYYPNGAATFASSVTANSLSIGSTSNSTNPANGSIVSAGGLGLGGDIHMHPFNANQSNYGYIKTAATTVNTTTLTIGTTYGFGTGVDAISIYNGSTTFTNNITAGGNISANNIRTFSLTLQGSGTPVSTGLPINALTGGRTYLLLTSQQWDAGNSTSSTITMIRCGYDGNNFTAVVLGSSNATLETWSQSGGILHVTGNTNFAMDITVISNG